VSGAWIDGEDRLASVVIAVEEEVKLALCQAWLVGREAQVARLVGKAAGGGGPPWSARAAQRVQTAASV
jgi:hypothetical protein